MTRWNSWTNLNVILAEDGVAQCHLIAVHLVHLRGEGDERGHHDNGRVVNVVIAKPQHHGENLPTDT